MNTEYSDMPDDEKDSDRAEADQMLAIGIERDREPFDIACKRIENAQRQGSLFAPESPADAYDQTNLDYQR